MITQKYYFKFLFSFVHKMFYVNLKRHININLKRQNAYSQGKSVSFSLDIIRISSFTHAN